MLHEPELSRAERIALRAKRKAERVGIARFINERAMHGDTPEEIAGAMGITESGLRLRAQRWGHALMQRKGFRRLSAWVSHPHVAALDALASDMGLSREKALGRVLSAALEGGAFVARRTLGEWRRAAA